MELVLIYNRQVLQLKRFKLDMLDEINYPYSLDFMKLKPKKYFKYLYGMSSRLASIHEFYLNPDEPLCLVTKGKNAKIVYESRIYDKDVEYYYRIIYGRYGTIIREPWNKVIAIYNRRTYEVSQVILQHNENGDCETIIKRVDNTPVLVIKSS